MASNLSHSMGQLQEAKALYEAELISKTEYERKKAKILGVGGIEIRPSKTALVRKGLPMFKCSYSSDRKTQRDPARPFHPSVVELWPDSKAAIRQRVQIFLQECSSEVEYDPVGFWGNATERNETDTVGQLWRGAGERLTELFDKNGRSDCFGMQPSSQPTDSQVEAGVDRLSHLALRLDENGKRIVPDMYCAPISGALRHIDQVTEVKIVVRLQGLEQIPGHLVTVWNFAVYGNEYNCPFELTMDQLDLCLDPDLQANVIGVLSQILHYMASYGLHTGCVSNYFQSWPVIAKEQGEKLVMGVGDPVECTTQGNEDGSQVSVCEILLWSWAVGVNEPKGNSYRVAKEPGLARRSLTEHEEFERYCREGAEAARAPDDEAQSRRTRSQAATSRQHSFFLHHATGNNAFYGSYLGEEAVMKFAHSRREKGDLQKEVEAYDKLKRLQGRSIPRKLAFLEAAGCPSCLIVSYVPGKQWQWKEHHTHAEQLLGIVSDFHSMSVTHNDLVPRNLKVQEDGRVVVLDFNRADTSAERKSQMSEYEDVQRRVALARRNFSAAKPLAPINIQRTTSSNTSSFTKTPRSPATTPRRGKENRMA